MTPHDRREFLRLAAATFASFAAACGQRRAEPPPSAKRCFRPRSEWLAPSNPNVGLPHLGGAPDEPLGWSIAAFVDTVVPGSHRDPTGAPGGLDAGTPGMFFDPALPALSFVPLLAGVLDSYAGKVRKNTSFATLSPEQREKALELALEIDQMEFAVQLAKLAYFSSREAACHLGYPGPNRGYVDDPLFSFGAPLTRELTRDGNYP